MQLSAFSAIPTVVEDEPFYLTALYQLDQAPKKVNLSVGAYRDGNGQPWPPPAVRKVHLQTFHPVMERDTFQNHCMMGLYPPGCN